MHPSAPVSSWSCRPSSGLWPGPKSPFCPLAVPMHFHNRGIHHRIFHVWLLAHCIEQTLKHIGLNPVSKAFEHRVPFAELRRQVSPGAACAAASRITWLAKALMLHFGPLLVCQYPSNAHAPIASQPSEPLCLILNSP